MTWLRYVPHDRVPLYMQLGWMLADLHLVHHSAYSVLMQWVCCCGRAMVEPKGGCDG